MVRDGWAGHPGEPVAGGGSHGGTTPAISAATPGLSFRASSAEPGASGPLRRFWRPGMSARANAETPAATALIVFGRDNGGKPHASRFDANEAELAEKAAGLMGMQVLRPENDEQRALAGKLPKGRVFASGRAFVPFVAAGLYGPLAAFGRPARVEAAGEPKSGCTAAPGGPAGHAPCG